MEVLWGFVVAGALLVLFLRMRQYEERGERIERELLELRRSLSRDWDQRRTAARAVEDRLAALEAGAPGSIEAPVEPASIESPATVVPAAAFEVTAPVESQAPAEPVASEPAAPVESPVTPEPSAPEPVAPPPVAPTPPPPPARPRIDLEQWLGVRGAAVGGGIIACLAAVMFFQHAIESNWISPTLRVVLGTLAGLSAITAAQTRHLRAYRITANAIAGAGLVALYASFWAAHVLYDLIGRTPTGGLMALVTAACCALAVRHASQQIALLGLAGGFATPLLLSSGSDRPIELFGYLLLLDAAFLALARRQRWPVLGLLGLAGTFCFQALWVLLHLDGPRIWLGVGILVAFALLFALAGYGREEEDGPVASITTGAAVLVPLIFGVYFAARSGLNAHPGPIFAMVLLVNAGAGWLGRTPTGRLLPLGAAAGALGVLATFLLFGSEVPHRFAWGAGVTVALALVHHGFLEWRARAGDDPLAALPARVAALGGGFLLVVAQGALGFVASQWTLGVAVNALLLAGVLRQAVLRGSGAVAPGFAAVFAALAIAEGLGQGAAGPSIGLATYLAAAFGVGSALQVWAMRASEGPRRGADATAALFAGVFLVCLPNTPHLTALPALAIAAALLGFALLVILPATRQDSGGWYFLAAVLGAFAFSVLVASGGSAVAAARPGVLAVLFLALILFAWWPVLTTGRFRTGRVAWYGAALAGPMLFPAARRLWEGWLGDGATGVLAVAFAAVSVGALARVQSQWDADNPIRTSVLAWLGAAALFFVSLAIPLQLERSWWTIGWALEGLAVVALWRRVDHPGLKWLALGLFGAVSARLLLNPDVLTYYDRGSWRIVNWLAYTYLVPMVALVVAAWMMRPLEEPRARPWESALYATPVRVASVLGFLAVCVGFAWVNLAVVDWFAEGPTLRVTLDRLPARDLSFSIAWAVYAVLLLAAGMARRIKGLRYLSLALLIVTIGKVFLYDLGHLEDLYRVASLVGLAVSLFLVSLAYQRFVFRDPAPAEGSP